MRLLALLLAFFPLISAFGFKNDTVCWKGTTDRGVGTVPDSCPPSMEKNGALCYPMCKTATPSFYGVGPVCWQHCKDGYDDEGALCRKGVDTYAKESYGRGVGTTLTCAPGLEDDAALCYKPCGSGYYGVGPVCWETCPKLDPQDDGAICCRNTTVCDKDIENLVLGLPKAVMAALLAGQDPTKIIQAVKDALAALLGFVMPLCSSLTTTNSTY